MILEIFRAARQGCSVAITLITNQSLKSSLIFIVKALLAGYRRKELACCVESLQLDLGLKSVLGLHHHINHLEPVIVPFPNAPEVSDTSFTVVEKHCATVRSVYSDSSSSNLFGKKLLPCASKIC